MKASEGQLLDLLHHARLLGVFDLFLRANPLCARARAARGQHEAALRDGLRALGVDPGAVLHALRSRTRGDRVAFLAPPTDESLPNLFELARGAPDATPWLNPNRSDR